MFDKTLATYRLRAGLNKTELARKVHVSLTYIANLESGRQKPPTPETCAHLAEALRLSPEERISFQELAVMERVKSTDMDTIRKILLPRIQAQPVSAPAAVPPGSNTVPLLDWSMINTPMTEHDIPVGLPQVVSLTPKEPALFALRITDTGMTPEFNPGDIVIINPLLEPRHHDFVLVSGTASQTPVLRQYRTYGNVHVLSTLTANMPEIVFDRTTMTSILGRVVERTSQTKCY